MGVTDRLSFGSGKEVMPYLKDGDERTLSLSLGLAEDGNMGHIVPGHNYILELVCLWPIMEAVCHSPNKKQIL